MPVVQQLFKNDLEQAAKKEHKAARRKAAKAVKAASKLTAATSHADAAMTVCKYTGCLVEAGSYGLSNEDETDEYHVWQSFEIMYLQRMLRVFESWRLGKYPSWCQGTRN